MSDVSTSIKWDKNSNPFMNGQSAPKVAQFSLSTNTLSSMVARYDVFSRNNKAKIPRLKPPYRKRDLDRFEDTFRSDGTVRRGVTTKWNFILGAHISVSLDVNKEYQDDEERAAALQAIMTYEPYKKAMDKANEILRRVNFRRVVHAAGIQASVYGRACIEKVRDPSDNNRLLRLNVLNSKLLGDVEVNRDTWEFLGVHYRDLPKVDNQDLLEKEDIIYMTRNDFHISSGSMYYGLSDLEPVIDGSETKRIIKQEDLKEIARALWAGFGWLLFKDPNISYTQMLEIVNQMKAGGWFATDQQVELHVQEIAQNAPMLLEIINEMNLETARDLAVPSPLVGYENQQNYSNLVQTLISWKESDLDGERRWLTSLVEEQLLHEIFVQELEIQGIKLPEGFGYNGENLMVTIPKLIPNEQPLNPLQPNSMMMEETLFVPPAKLTLDVEDPNFQTPEKRVANAMLLYNEDLISARKVLQESEMEDQIEETEIRLSEKKMKEEQFKQQQLNIFQQEANINTAISGKRMGLINSIESKLGELNNGGSGNSTQAKKTSFPSLRMADVINDPEIKSLYQDFLKAKKAAYESAMVKKEDK